MKRSPLNRKTPLQSHSALTSKRPMHSKRSSRAKSREFSASVKQKVRDRSNSICEMCHMEPAVHFHHCTYRSQLGTGDIWNCLYLGLACHESCHSKREARERAVELAHELARATA